MSTSNQDSTFLTAAQARWHREWREKQLKAARTAGTLGNDLSGVDRDLSRLHDRESEAVTAYLDLVGYEAKPSFEERYAEYLRANPLPKPKV